MKILIHTLFFFLLVTQICEAQWVQSGPDGGSIFCFAVSGTNLFAGGAYGAFHSTDNGTSWTAVNSGLTNTNVHAFATLGTSLFAGTFGGGVFRSTNSGASWIAVNSGLTGYVQAFAVSGTNLFAGTAGFITGGVFLSTNNGTSWTEVTSGLPPGMARDVRTFAMSSSNIFIGTGAGVFLSTNNGTSWTAVNNGLTDDYVQALTVSGTNLFAGTNWGGVFLSTNNGTSWTACGLTSCSVYALTISGANLFAGTSNGLFLSSNNGTSWMPADSGLTASDIRCFALRGETLFAGAAGSGIFLSTNNGASWTIANSGLAHPNVSSLSISGANLFAGTYDDGLFLSSNNGTSWSPANSGLVLNVKSLAASGTNLLAGTFRRFDAGMFLSTNDGTSWTLIGGGITVVASGTTVLAATWGCELMGCWGEVVLSTDEGINWTATSFEYGGQLSTPPCLAISGTNLFVGTAYWPTTGVFLSTDNGLSWTTVNSGLTDSNVVSLFVGGESLFAGTENGLFCSTNNGANWTDASAGLTGTPISFAVSPNGTGETNLFAGTDSCGVFLSTNNGTSWAEVSTGLTDSSISSLSVSGTSLFAGTTSGVWRRPLSEMITDFEDIGHLPKEFLLSQNFPNPFNPSTAIKYSVPKLSNVVIKVFDILGNEIETLVNDEKPAGTYEITWYAEQLPSGVYFYQLKAGEFLQTKKMLLLK